MNDAASIPGVEADAQQTERAATAAVYRLLAGLWRRELGPTVIAELAQSPLGPALQALGIAPPQVSRDVVEKLEVDFCQLFLGPRGHRPPVQSVWQTGQFQNRAAVSMRRYLDLLATLDGLWGEDELSDHLSMQLDAMGAILGELSRLSEDAHQARTDLEELAASLFRAHLTWPTPLFRFVEARAETSFYRDLATLTGRFLDLEAERYSQTE